MTRTETEFFPAPHPYHDFAYIYTSGSQTKGIDDVLRETSLSISRLSQKEVFVSSSLSGDSELSFSGWGFSRSENVCNLIYSDCDEGKTRITPYCTGNFSCADFSGKYPTFYCDYLGMGTVYYYYDKIITIVTNRPHLAALLIGCVAGKTKPNSSYFLSLILDHPFFSHQPFSSEFPICDFRRVPVNHSLVLRNGRVQVRPVDIGFWVPPSEKLRYADHIELVSSEIADYTESIVRKFGIEKVVFDLSGGKDSRLAIAPVLGKYDGIRVRTKDNPNLDFDIACLIADKYGLRFERHEKKSVNAEMIDNPLDMWTSYTFGEYHVNYLSSELTCNGNTFVRVTGSAGEIYRDFWPKLVGDTCGLSVIDHLLNNRSPNLNRLSESTRREVERYISKVAHIKAKNGYDYLSKAYLEYRNRYHFGLRLYSTRVDSCYLTPLVSRDFWNASKRLRDRGEDLAEFIRSVTIRICPSLGSIPYGTDDNAIGECGKHSSMIRSKRETVFGHIGVKAVPKSVVSPAERERRRIDFGSDLDRRFGSALSYIKEAANSPAVSEVCDKVFDRYESLMNSEVISRKILRETRILQSRVISGAEFLKISGPRSWRDRADSAGEYLNPIDRIDVSITKDGISASVIVRKGINVVEFEFSYYLFSGSNVIYKRWYSGENEVLLIDGISDATKLVVFARRGDKLSRVYKKIVPLDV